MVKEIDEVEQIDFPLQMLLRIIGIICMVSYTLYHCYNGNYGLKNYMNKQDIINKKNIIIKESQKELADIKNKINKLQDTNLDSDLLDEEIRKNTGYLKQNEIVIYTDVFNQE